MLSFKQFLFENKYSGITLYHGSNKEFDKFDFNMAGRTDSGFIGKGFYLTANKFMASAYADDAATSHGGEAHILDFVINTKKTLEINGTSTAAWRDAMDSLGIKSGSMDQQTKEIKALGFDSIAAIYNGKIKEFVVLDKNIYRRKR